MGASSSSVLPEDLTRLADAAINILNKSTSNFYVSINDLNEENHAKWTELASLLKKSSPGIVDELLNTIRNKGENSERSTTVNQLAHNTNERANTVHDVEETIVQDTKLDAQVSSPIDTFSDNEVLVLKSFIKRIAGGANQGPSSKRVREDGDESESIVCPTISVKKEINSEYLRKKSVARDVHTEAASGQNIPTENGVDVYRPTNFPRPFQMANYHPSQQEFLEQRDTNQVRGASQMPQGSRNIQQMPFAFQNTVPQNAANSQQLFSQLALQQHFLQMHQQMQRQIPSTPQMVNTALRESMFQQNQHFQNILRQHQLQQEQLLANGNSGVSDITNGNEIGANAVPRLVPGKPILKTPSKPDNIHIGVPEDSVHANGENFGRNEPVNDGGSVVRQSRAITRKRVCEMTPRPRSRSNGTIFLATQPRQEIELNNGVTVGYRRLDGGNADGSGQYECARCDKTFGAMTPLKRHRCRGSEARSLSRTPVSDRLKCDMCGNTYASQRTLSVHQARKHPYSDLPPQSRVASLPASQNDIPQFQASTVLPPPPLPPILPEDMRALASRKLSFGVAPGCNKPENGI